MKYFFKDNSYSIFKMFINQLGMTIFGLTLSMATSQNDTLFLITSIFAVCFYMVLLYCMTWDIGYEEKIRIDAGRLDYNPFKGFFLSLSANALNFILAVMIISGYYGASSFIEGAPASPEWAVNIFGIGRMAAGLLEAMYGGIINVVFNLSPWSYLIIPIPAIITCTLAYNAGVKGFRIFPASKKDQNKE